MAEPGDSPVVTESVPAQTSTYEWLCNNPLTASCGTTLCSFYQGSKNYNRVTKFALGSVESAVSFAAGTARPVVGKVVEKLDRPSASLSLSLALSLSLSLSLSLISLSLLLSSVNTVDGIVANQLVKLGDKYPVLTKEPGEVSTRRQS